MCLYSEFTQSWETMGQSASSAGICGAAGGLLPTTKGEEAKTSCMWLLSIRSARRSRAAPSQNQDLFQFLDSPHATPQPRVMPSAQAAAMGVSLGLNPSYKYRLTSASA